MASRSDNLRKQAMQKDKKTTQLKVKTDLRGGADVRRVTLKLPVEINNSYSLAREPIEEPIVTVESFTAA